MTNDGKCPSPEFHLVLEDNFDSDSLDLNKWEYAQPWGNHSIDGFKYSLEYQTDGTNYKFENGILNLIIRREKIFAKAIKYMDSCFVLNDGGCNMRWWNYTAGMIFSKNKYGYGKYEIRCKIPKGKGFWPAFWLYGDGDEEIDVFEFSNERDIFGNLKEKNLSHVNHMTIHSGKSICPSNVSDIDYSADFHVYALIWMNNKMEWYIDGKLKRTSYKFYSLLGQPMDCDQIQKDNFYLQDKAFL